MGCFYRLALALARDFVPGFQEQKRRGARSKWTPFNKAALVVEIERIVWSDDRTHGVKWAAMQLAKDEPWRSFIKERESDYTSPDPTEVLRKMYYDFRNDRWANVMRDAFKLHEHNGEIPKWESQVADFVNNPHPKKVL